MTGHGSAGEAGDPGAASAAGPILPSPPDPIHWLSKDLTAAFGGRVRKVGLDAGGSCPNRDGTIGRGGCAWCDPGGSGPDDLLPGEPWETRLARLSRRASEEGSAGVIAYFQAFTATHATRAEALERRARRALSVPGVVGVAFATRPDCLGDRQLAGLGRLAREAFIWIEVGMQTASDRTLAALNRGHLHSDTVGAVRALQVEGVRTVLHLILGLPGENDPEFHASLDEAARLRPWGLKIHPLHVVEGSALSGLWRRGSLSLLDRERYVALVADGLELLPPAVTIHRLTGERPRGVLLGPDWCADKRRTLGAIAAELARRGSYQGSRAGS